MQPEDTSVIHAVDELIVTDQFSSPGGANDPKMFLFHPWMHIMMTLFVLVLTWSVRPPVRTF